ncbi:Anthranilate synthase component 1, partial [Bienertia sinuspersici]
KCLHDEIAPLRTVIFHGPTRGKRFYGCPYWPIIRKGVLGRICEEAKRKNSKLEDDVNELALENAVKFESMESVKADKKLVFAMLLSWNFFAVVLLTK